MGMRPLPKDYNGFTQKERLDGWQVQKRARRALHDGFCSICKLDKSTGVMLINHVEDYRHMLDDVRATCPECHERLHRRFDQPKAWINYLLRLREGYQPPPYKSYSTFRSNNTDKDDLSAPAFTPDPTKWYEMLSLTPINVPAGDAVVPYARSTRDTKQPSNAQKKAAEKPPGPGNAQSKWSW